MDNINSNRDGWWDARIFLVLWSAALVGSAAIFPYALRLTGVELSDLGVNPALAWIASTVQSGILVALAILLGMRLGPAVGLGPYLLRGVLNGQAGVWQKLKRGLAWAVLLGLSAGVLIILLDITIFSAGNAQVNLGSSNLPPVWMGFLASFYGGIVEELLLRFGVMTLLVWLISKIPGVKESRGWVVWFGIVGAALLFGAGHLPATAAIAPLTPMLVLRALLLNGIPGVIFGWLYLRHGLLVAIASHFTADIVLHVLFPLLNAAG